MLISYTLPPEGGKTNFQIQWGIIVQYPVHMPFGRNFSSAKSTIGTASGNAVPIALKFIRS